MRFLIIILPLLFAVSAAAQQQALSAKGAVSNDTPFVGEPFTFQIQVSGSDKPAAPNLSGLTDFSVTPKGGGSNSSTQVTIVNGQVNQKVHKGYNFNFELVPKREGALVIPAISIQADGKTVQTQPIRIVSRRPAETDNFKLRAAVSKNPIYVGEPVILEWTFLYNAEIDQRSTNLTMPVLDNPDLFFYDLDAGENQVATLDGKQYHTMRMKKAVIPQKSGVFEVPASTLTFRGLAGYEMRHDFFGRPVKSKKYQPFVIPSNALTLQVQDVPAQGRPANFAGHVGVYNIQASATPSQVNVGDPITLTVAISGPEYLEHIEMPPLARQSSLTRDFRLPTEAADGKIQGRAKVYTQSIRATNDKIKQIPPLELAYFNTQTGSYQVARSAPIPIFVRPTKEITALDAEGLSPVVGQTNALQAFTQGIAHNYEGSAALRHQDFQLRGWFGSAGFIAMTTVPPLGYVAFLVLLLAMRKRKADPKGVKERGAMRTFNNDLSKAEDSDAVLDALRSYLGNKLRLDSGALTFKDVKEPLGKKGVGEDVVESIREIFDACEASRYAGGSTDVGELVAKCKEAAAAIEKPKRKIGGANAAVGLILAVLLSTPGLLRAELSEGEIYSLFQEGNQFFRQANEMSAQNSTQAQELYRSSLLRYERIVREGGVRNGQLFYNIGNAYFRLDDVGRAILNYRRALELTPNDTNLQQNLAYARMRRADKIEVEAQQRVMETLFFFHYDIPKDVRALLFGVSFVVIWIAAGVLLVFSRPFLKWVIGISAGIALLFLVSLIIDAKAEGGAVPGVIVSSEVIARKGDSETYERSFQKPLHAGTEFNVVEARVNWLHAELADGRRCWLPAQAVELLEVQPRVLSAGGAL